MVDQCVIIFVPSLCHFVYNILIAFIGIYNFPPICIGYIVGGLIMKKFKITVIQAAHIGCWLSFTEYLFYFLCFFMICDSSSVAGITTSYEGYVVF